MHMHAQINCISFIFEKFSIKYTRRMIIYLLKIFLIVNLFDLFESGSSSKEQKRCSSLIPNKGVILDCRTPMNVSTYCMYTFEMGSTINYKCDTLNSYHPRIHSPMPPSQRQLFCDSNGQWTNLKKLHSYHCEKGCKPPSLPFKNIHIQCYYGNSQLTNCDTVSSPEGAWATYNCREFWNSQSGRSTAELECINGVWEPINPPLNCRAECGVSRTSIGGRISIRSNANGGDNYVGKWPWHVGLYHEHKPRSGNFSYLCGGSLISPRAVLTAAHCLTTRSGKILDGTILAFVGKFNRTYRNDDEYVQAREIKEIDIFPKYSSRYYKNDIAIAWLNQDVEITERVRPVCIPQDDDVVTSGANGMLAGWGRGVNRKFPEQLQDVQLPVVGVEKCKNSHQILEAYSRPTTFCAGYLNGPSACDGDSGGGLMFEENGKWYIQGILSSGVYRRTGGCDPNYYTVYTRVDKYKTWIFKLLSKNVQI